MKKIIKICMFVSGFQLFALYADSSLDTDKKQETDVKIDAQNTASLPEAKPKAESQSKSQTKNTPTKPDTKKKSEPDSKVTSFKTTLFVNGRINNILLVITDNQNKQFKITIRPGTDYSCGHKAQSLKKVVCYELNATNITLSQSDLNTYSVFVFNTDQKTEKHNFINIHQKNLALNRARKSNNITLFHEISDQSIYNP